MASNSGLPPSRMAGGGRRSRVLPKTTFDLLIDMGFSKQLSEKVIAAVGDKDIHVAVDWLMSHLEDPSFKEPTPRECVIYLCPGGALHRSLMDYWERSEVECGWSAVHNHFPHITLTPFFNVTDDKMPKLIEAFTSLQDQLQNSPGSLHLERYSVPNFIGLFVPTAHHAYFEKIMAQFSANVASLGIELEQRKKELHLTLAYHFTTDQYDKLHNLSELVDTGQDVRWDLRLYSRDQRHAKSEVYVVQQDFTASTDDEIELIEGDYMFVGEGESGVGDGWYQGASWLTGCSGVFPSTFCKRTAEMWTWTLHKSISLEKDVTDSPPPYNDVCETDIIALYSKRESQDSLADKLIKVKRRRSTAPALPPRKVRGPRRVYVMRHGERVDFVMGKEWITECFDAQGNYIRTDVNMPRQVARRKEPSHYIGDSPLTEIGLFQAQKTAESIFESGVRITIVYASPSFRCIQTATQIIRGLGLDLMINIDPSLFEWLQWYQVGIPRWLSADELIAHGYPINRTYTPIMSREQLGQRYNENVAQYYDRNNDFMQRVLSRHTESGEGIIIVGHAATLDVCMRQARGLQPRTPMKFQEFVCKVPYCSIAAYEEDVTTKKWSLIESPALSLTHSANKGMYWKANTQL